jgi:pimeloyl-ACP methyl ester carboxylesterase
MSPQSLRNSWHVLANSPSLETNIMKHDHTRHLFVLLLLLISFVGPSVFLGHATNGQVPAPKAGAPSLVGIWVGVVDIGGAKIRLTLKATKDTTGEISAKLDVIDQGAIDLKVDTISQQGTAVRFEVKAAGLSYEGALNEAGTEISGNLKQGTAQFPLLFKRTDVAPTLGRPQDPVKPYPYDEEEVGYENKSDGVHLAGTLTLPRTKGPHPAVLLITGSGSQDRDETIARHRPFLVLADYLTRHGIAVLRVDDRGMGGSSRGDLSATSENFAGDVLTGVEYLKNRKEINPKQIGLAGHSEGGMIAPMVAARSTDVAFIVLIAGLGQTGADLILKQNVLALRANGVSDWRIDQTLIALKQMFAILKAEPDNVIAERKMSEALARQVGAMNAEQKQSFAPDEATIKSGSAVFLIPWFRFFLAYDPAPTLRRVTVPVLAINGEVDQQVPGKENLELIAAALKAGGNKDYTTMLLPKLNHLLQTSQTGALSEYGQIEETIAPVALETITTWILRHTTPR